jgi:hypothetical protein
MLNRESAEKALHARLAGSTEICNLGASIKRGCEFGSVVLLGDRPIGLWSVIEQRFALRDFASYEPSLDVGSIEEAIDVTVALLTLCQSGWAERFGPIGAASRAA